MTALLLIDIQEGFKDLKYWGGHRNNPEAEENCLKLLHLFRSMQWPLFHVQHCSVHPDSPLYPGKPGHAIKKIVQPQEGEAVIQKDVNSAFIGTDLLDRLHSLKVDTVVLVGFTTDHCVSSSARMAANLGLQTIVVSDATATFDKTGIDGDMYDADLLHKTALASLHKEFAQILDTRSVLSRLQS